MDNVIVTSKGQVVIPAKYRKKFNIKRRRRLDEVIHLISSLPIQIVQADMEVTRQAAEFKSCKKMSSADCYAVATAKHYKAELVTGDLEFKEVEKEIQIIWIH
jgi:bifunctional DNA-binding transcriptional regulator/antitoxin component of YhaV-PrlF toxin-antitoxin module